MRNTEDTEASPAEFEIPKKKSPILLILAVAVIVGGAATAWVLLGKAKGPSTTAAAKEPAAAPPAKDLIKDSISMAPMVVDARDGDGMLRHVKLALTIEVNGDTSASDLRPYLPRGREAAIAFLRSQGFEALTDPRKFEHIRDELGKRVLSALGQGRASRVLVTDFVAQ